MLRQAAFSKKNRESTCYYRILNGSTQVNSTEINAMPVPPMNMIEAMGKALIRSKDMSEASCDNILRSFI